MATNKRRLIPIVDRRFQFKYTGLICLVAAIVSTALGYFLLDAYMQLNSMIEVSEAIGDRLNSDDAQRVFVLVIGFLVGEVVLLGVAGLLITHRVVGPVFVLHRHLATLAEGKYPTLRPLRESDEFKATFDAFSETLQMFRDRDEREARELNEVLEAARGKGVDAAQLETLQRLVDEREARTRPEAS